MIQTLSLLLSISLLFAIGFGFLGYPYLLGYISTGILLSRMLNKDPENLHLIENLGEFGLLLLIFMIGIEFDLFDFKKRWKKSTAIFLIQSMLSVMLSVFLSVYCNLSFQICLLLICLFVISSSGVVFKLLDELKKLDTSEGALISGLLILQDFAVIPLVIILKNSNSSNLTFDILWKISLALVVIVSLIQYLTRAQNKLLFKPIKMLFENNNETITLAALTICLTFACVSEKVGLSIAYGPLLAGLILGSFGNKHEIIKFAKPIESLLMMVFFIFVGSKIDTDFVYFNLKTIGFYSALLFIFKILLTFASLFIVKKIFKSKTSYASMFFVALTLAQASEFSFVFITILIQQNALSAYMINLINSIVVISLTLGALIPAIYQKLYNYINNDNIS